MKEWMRANRSQSLPKPKAPEYQVTPHRHTGKDRNQTHQMPQVNFTYYLAETYTKGMRKRKELEKAANRIKRKDVSKVFFSALGDNHVPVCWVDSDAGNSFSVVLSNPDKSRLFSLVFLAGEVLESDLTKFTSQVLETENTWLNLSREAIGELVMETWTLSFL